MKFFPKLNDENWIKSIFLYLTIGTALVLVFPYLDMQTALSQGDHGRDLYAFDRILHGERPYKDFWWVYGPLMPYYYAAFFKAFGVNIMSVILGKLVLAVVNAVVFYLILIVFAPPALAFLAAIYYLAAQNDFFFTYNHIGGLTFMLLLMLSSAHYLTSKNPRWLYAGLAVIVLLALVKLNFGVVSLLAITLLVFTTDKLQPTSVNRLKFYITALVLTPLIIVAAYLFFLSGLSVPEIRQCLPFLPGDQPHEFPLMQTVSQLLEYLRRTMFGSGSNRIMTVFVFGGMFYVIKDIRAKALDRKIPAALMIFMAFVAGYAVLNLHEFLRSNIWYRLGWAQPPFYLAVFLLIAVLWKRISPLIEKFLYAVLVLVCFSQGFLYFNRACAVKIGNGIYADIKTPEHYLNHPRGKVYLTYHNSPDWISTVTAAAEILDTIVKDDETFFALPYDPLYYYLTGRKSPTRQTIFFEHIHIPETQERGIIAELENNRTNWILLSSRVVSAEYGLGKFGTTYCPVLADYIYRNFHVVGELGNWTDGPGWTDPHGVRILKRDQK